MLKINKKIEYALIALRHMSEKRPGELTTAKEICAVYKSPFDVMSRVLQVMAQNNILKSEHGVRGGYLIQKDPAKISFLALMEMILGPVKLADCLREKDNSCDLISSCNIVSPIMKLNEKMKSFYEKIMISDLIIAQDARRNKNLTEAFAV